MIPPLLAIFAWPVAAAALFANLRKPLALLATILGGFLLLPEGTEIDLPLLPALDKRSIPALAALVFCAAMASRPGDAAVRPGFLPASPLARLLLAILVAGAFATIATNGDNLFYGPRVVPGLRLYDALSAILSLIMALLPALLARKYLGGPDGHRLVLAALCVAALGYSLFALVEIRLSPQMNNWVYGFFPHDWRQHVRAGGFRPLVFLSHGLMLAMVFCMAALAAAGLSRADPGRRTAWMLAAGWLMMVLLLSNSLGALAIAMALVPVVLFASIRVQMIVAAGVAAIFLTFPILRGADLVPIDAIVSAAASVSEERAGSLQFRFDHEETLLEKASERPVFGWGGWGRSRVFDAETGEDVSVTDGYWVILIGIGGWVGYLGQFGFLAGPVLLVLWRSRTLGVGRETAVLALILAANLIDMLPNASLTPLTWLLAGALWGRLEHAREAAAETGAATADPAPARVGYARPRPALSGAPVAPDAPAAPDGPVTAYTRQAGRIVRETPAAAPARRAVRR